MWNLKVSVSGSAAASGRASGAGLESGGGKGRWSAKRKAGVDLVLLGHKRLAPQKGAAWELPNQPGRDCIPDAGDRGRLKAPPWPPGCPAGGSRLG